MPSLACRATMTAESAERSRPLSSEIAGERQRASYLRLGGVLRRLRWPVLILWVLAVVLLHPLASSLSKVTNDTSSAYLPPSAQSTRVALLQQASQHRVGQPVTNEAVVVFVRPGGLTTADLTAVAAARSAVERLSDTIPGLGQPGPARRSADGKAAAFVATVSSQANSATGVDTIAIKAIGQAAQTVTKEAGLQVAVTGSAAENADIGQGSQTRLLLTALVIVVIILLLVYRSPVLWLLPVIGALGAIVVAQAAAHSLANAGLTVSSLSSSILIVLVFGAATDYALLLTHRYREELRHHAAVENAMAAALRTTLPTLAASAATVTGAMLCLLAAESASLHGLGPVGAVAIVSALLAQATLLPALLLVLGRRAFWPRIPRPGAAGGEESRAWSTIGSRAASRPGLIVLGGVVVLAAAGLGLTALRIDNNPIANLKGNPQSVVGARLVTAHFGPGALDPIVLLVPPREATTAVRVTRAISAIAGVSPEAPVEGYAAYSVTLAVDPYGAQAAATVKDLRRQLEAAPGSLVGGDPAISYDLTQAADRDTAVLIPLVLAVILLVVAVLLQAIVAPLLLVATTALSFAASFGLANLLWRHGLGYSGIEAGVDLYIFVFLVALGVDYNIFLTARIREEARKLGTPQGILRGLRVTGGVITAAGVVLAGTFLALTENPQVTVTEVGTAVAIGVLLDTLLVRTILVPATFLTIKDRIWWPGGRSRGEPVAVKPGAAEALH
jgi:putative drug exporter of the RND superfamily